MDPAGLTAYGGAAAGHEGVLADASGEIIVKPCTQAEADFYQETLLQHEDFTRFMPSFMGTLQLGAPANVAKTAAAQEMVAENAGSEVLPGSKAHSKQLFGTKIKTELAIVLENLEHGFKHPSIMDIKLGSRLYDDDTAPDKVERMKKVSAETTSGSLGFRNTGMRVWNGQTTDVYDKFYGRQLTAENVGESFQTFFRGLKAELPASAAARALKDIEADIRELRKALETKESRMYGASILVVYEGDGSALREVMADQPRQTSKEAEDSEDEEAPPVTSKVKLIDFAHAHWTPGQGKDENVIAGLINVEKQMQALIQSA
ncbi:SAICAR synthase-like protein [Piedraia hortae CBS 480.64]|uniref:Kinase n=1 Tax=Piedraia hortae CBS 480.64 TaxID=1314780 RepID=A0A6A7C2R4_9PEZI|nr:SAICAR synthase-like protein [Piedraia hortae CBS 480.64]